MQRTGLDQHFEDIEPEKRRTAGGRQEITALDERYLRVTEQELYGELSVVLGIEKENMHDYIQEQIAAL